MAGFTPIAVWLFIAIAMIGMNGTSAHAALMEKDLNAAGDDLITLDTATGLEWLDVVATLGLSYNDAKLSSFVTAQGFRHASETEVFALYASVGVTDLTGQWIASNFAGVQELLAKLGCTEFCDEITPFQLGWADLDPLSATDVAHPAIGARLSMSDAQAFCFSFTPGECSPFPNNSTYSNTGNYLVRTAAVTVPEPPSWALIGGGLAVLAGFRRRRGNT